MIFLAHLMMYLIPTVLLVLLVYFSNFIVNIRGNQIGIVERKYFGRKLPDGRVIAMHKEIGIQAWMLGPGLHFLFPFIYKVEKQLFTEISQDEIGIVEAVDGNPLEPGHIFAVSAEKHDFFQNGEAFLENGGQKGPQVDIIPPGVYRINTSLFRVTKAKATVIPQGKIGVVNAMDGVPIDSGRLLGKVVEAHDNFQDGNAFLKRGGQKGPQLGFLLPGTYRINTDMFEIKLEGATIIEAGKIGLVTAKDGQPLPDTELVAKSVSGHDNHQNGSAFLNNGGQRGPQLDVLPPGTYYINPLMFTVIGEDAAVVEQGQVAVIVSNVGKEPDRSVVVDEPDLGGKIERYVVPKGYRGIQEQVVGPGTYYVNKRAFKPVLVNTTNITIDWDSADNTKFDPLNVISKDGFNIKVGVKVVIRVQPEQAPYMLARIGSIDNLIYHVIHPLVDSSFRNQASSTEAMEFLQDRHKQQELAEERIRKELSKYHVDVLSVLICQIDLPKDLMETQTNKVLANQKEVMFFEQQKAEFKRIEMEKTKAEADKQPALVAAEIDVKIANQRKLQTITIAEGDAKKTELEGDGESKKILSIGSANAESYERIKQAIGPQGVVAMEVMKLISAGKIKIVPDILINGKDGGGSLLDVLLAQMVKEGKYPIINMREAAAANETPVSNQPPQV